MSSKETPTALPPDQPSTGSARLARMVDERTLATYLRELAQEVLSMGESTNPEDDVGYWHGRRMTLYEVVPLLQVPIQERTGAVHLRDLAQEIVSMAESPNPEDDLVYRHGRRMAL